MSSLSGLRERYLSDPVSIRLGGIAANLARIGTFSDNPAHGDAVCRLVRESEFFIEWTAADVPRDHLADLADLQRTLAVWHYSWPRPWSDQSARERLAAQAGQWSQRVLAMSGLLPREA
jgi:hypothetical protein